MDTRDRQRASAAMTKCGCGNVARLGTTICGRCESENDEALAKNQLLQKAYNATTLEELREVVVGLADRVLQ